MHMWYMSYVGSSFTALNLFNRNSLKVTCVISHFWSSRTSISAATESASHHLHLSKTLNSYWWLSSDDSKFPNLWDLRHCSRYGFGGCEALSVSVLFCVVLSSRVFYWLSLRCLVLSCPLLLFFWLEMSCLGLSCLLLPCLAIALPCVASLCLAIALLCLALPCLRCPCLALSYLALSALLCLSLPCLVLSWLVLPWMFNLRA